MIEELEPTLPTWVDRALGRPRQRALDPGRLEDQTGFPADYFAYMPDAAESFPVAPILASVARGLQVQVRRRDAPRRRTPAVQQESRATHTSFRLTFAGEIIVLPKSLQRSYAFFINTGAFDIFLAFGKEADAAAIPLRTPDGFYELTFGTVSEVRAFCPGGTGELRVVEGLYFPPLIEAG